MAEDKESVFIGTLFYFVQNNHTVFMQFSQIEKNTSKKYCNYVFNVVK